jgi:hypothetical protein
MNTELKAKFSKFRPLKQSMSVGDLISGMGEKKSNGSIYLRTVEYVGLRELLGFWSSENQYFEFRDFKNLNLYKSVGKKVKSLHYSTAPGMGDSWKVFITDENTIILSTLRIDNDEALLTFYNTDTGKVTGEVKLKKFPVQPFQLQHVAP